MSQCNVCRGSFTWRLEELRDAAAERCRYCTLVWDGLRCCIPKVALSGTGYTVRAESIGEWVKGVTLIKNPNPEHEPPDFNLEFFPLKDDPSRTWNLVEASVPLTGDTGSEASWARALEWIQDCVKNHSICNKNEGPALLPTRVVDVGLHNIDGRIKLHVAHNRETGRYVCLSHCWGQTRPLTTTKETLEERTEGISWKSLPQTFQDAITVARRLSVQYIWIDSLCIVQDDQLDWQKEAARMASIYRNAFLTIAATKSSGSTDGCFNRSMEQPLQHKLTSVDADGRPFQVYVRLCLPHWRDSLTEIVAETVNGFKPYYLSNPLYSRAWVLQERILSARVLHFTLAELTWECIEEQHCECGDVSMRPQTPMNVTRKRYVGGLDSFANYDSRLQFLFWRSIICQYSMLKLTFAKDQLPALAGLARQIQPYHTGRYLAGLWEDRFMAYLMWYSSYQGGGGITGQTPLLARPQPKCAPTWSWASVGRSIGFLPLETDVHVKILEVNCTPAGIDPFGEIKSGCLRLSGYLVPATLRFRDWSQYELGFSIPTFIQRDLSPQIPIPGFEPFRNIAVTSSDVALFVHADYDYGEEGDSKMEAGQTIYLLRVDRDLCLVLRNVDDLMQYYERIGITRLTYRIGASPSGRAYSNLDDVNDDIRSYRRGASLRGGACSYEDIFNGIKEIELTIL